MNILKKNLAGEVTWQYDGVILSRQENVATIEALFNRDDMPFMDIVLKRSDRFVETFYSDRWYNIFEIYDRDDDQFKGWYCNIGKPAIIEADCISYVDLALDLWVSANGKQTVLDEDELGELKLDDELKQKVYDALHELQTWFAENHISGPTKNPPS
jgi:protein associated with RNAse G/E